MSDRRWRTVGEHRQKGFSEDDECFPKAVRFRLGENGELSDTPTEPIAADAREGKDGRENAVIKLMAGLLGVGFDDLRRREQAYQRQRVRRLQITSGVFALLFIAAISAAVYAVSQKRTVQRTLSRSDLQLAVLARDNDDVSRSVAYLARSLRSDPENRGAAMAAYSFLAHHKMHPPVGPLLRHPARVYGAFGSADGKFIVTAAGKSVYVWSGSDHRLLGERVLDGSDVLALAPLQQGIGFVAGTSKGMLFFLGTDDLKSVRDPVDTKSHRVSVLAWNPAENVLAAGLQETADSMKSRGLLVRFALDGTEISRQVLERVSPLSLAWSKDGSQLAAAGGSPYFYVSSGKADQPELKELHSKLAICGLSFTEKGTLRLIDVYTGLAEWDTAAGTLIGRPSTLGPVPTSVSFSPDGTTFLGTRRGPSAYIYDAKSGKVPTEPISPAFTVSNGAWLDDAHILLYSENGMAQVRQIRNAAPAAKLGHFRGGYPDISALSRDGKIIAACFSSDSLVRFFDTATLKEISRPLRFPTTPHEMAFLADPEKLGALCWDGKFHSVTWRKALKYESGPEALVPEVAESYLQITKMRFNPQGTLAALPRDTGVMIIDTVTGASRKLIPIDEGGTTVAWSLDGSVLAVATHKQELLFFKPDGSPAKGLVNGKLNAPVVDLAWSPQGGRIAALTNSDRVDFFNPATGTPAAASIATGTGCESLLWVSSGKWLLVADSYNVVRLWDVDTGLAVATLPKIGATYLRSHALPERGEVLLATDSGFARIPLPDMTTPPDWLPGFLEGLGGGRLSAGKNEPLIDPDSWLASDALPASSAVDPVWSPPRAWLLDSRKDRPAAVGSDMTEPEAAKVLEMSAVESEVGAMRKKMGELWKTNDDEKMADALDLMDKAIKMDPDLTALQKILQQVHAFSHKPVLDRDAWLAIAAAGDSTLIEVLEAKAGAAREMLKIPPPDLAAARKLVDEVLAEDPEHAAAKEVSGLIDAATK